MSDSYDFSLQSESPCIGSADPLSDITIDIDSSSRDESPDIGAYEYSEPVISYATNLNDNFLITGSYKAFLSDEYLIQTFTLYSSSISDAYEIDYPDTFSSNISESYSISHRYRSSITDLFAVLELSSYSSSISDSFKTPGYDFSLLSSSPCIGAADATSEITSDIDNEDRDASPDIGCYEYRVPTYLYSARTDDAYFIVARSVTRATEDYRILSLHASNILDLYTVIKSAFSQISDEYTIGFSTYSSYLTEAFRVIQAQPDVDDNLSSMSGLVSRMNRIASRAGRSTIPNRWFDTKRKDPSADYARLLRFLSDYD